MKPIPVQRLHTAYVGKGQDMVLSPLSSKQMRVFNAKIVNRSGGFCNVGLLTKLANTSRKVWYNNATARTEKTTLADAGSAFQINASSAGTGLVVQAKKKFNMIGIVVSTASTGSPTFSAKYYNGSTWTTLPDMIQTISFAATGYVLLVFSAPFDWAVGGYSDTDTTMYSVEILTTSSGNSAEATSCIVAQMIDYAGNVNQDSGIEYNCDPMYPLVLEANEGIIPFFGTSHAGNLISAVYSQDD